MASRATSRLRCDGRAKWGQGAPSRVAGFDAGGLRGRTLRAGKAGAEDQKLEGKRCRQTVQQRREGWWKCSLNTPALAGRAAAAGWTPRSVLPSAGRCAAAGRHAQRCRLHTAVPAGLPPSCRNVQLGCQQLRGCQKGAALPDIAQRHQTSTGCHDFCTCSAGLHHDCEPHATSAVASHEATVCRQRKQEGRGLGGAPMQQQQQQQQ